MNNQNCKWTLASRWTFWRPPFFRRELPVRAFFWVMLSGVISLWRTFVNAFTHHHSCLSFSSRSILADYSIHSTNISLISPQKLIITAPLSSAQWSIVIFCTVINLLYDPDRRTIQNRMVYESAWCRICVFFYDKSIPCNVLAPQSYMDEIRVKSFDMGPIVMEGEKREEGWKIVEHRIEVLIEVVWRWLQDSSRGYFGWNRGKVERIESDSFGEGNGGYGIDFLNHVL